MRPYVGIVLDPSIDSPRDHICAASEAFYDSGFIAEDSTHSPAFLFDYALKKECESTEQLDAVIYSRKLNDVISYTEEMVSRIALGIRLQLPPRKQLLDPGFFSLLSALMPKISMIQFSHSSPPRSYIDQIRECNPELTFLNHVSSNLSDVTLNYLLDRNSYDHYVFDTKGPGFFKRTISSKRKAGKKDSSIGFSANLKEGEKLNIRQITMDSENSFSLEARCDTIGCLKHFISVAGSNLLD